MRSPLLTPDGRALHNKPTIDLNELLDEPAPVTPEIPIRVADYSLPPLEKVNLPCPPPRMVADPQAADHLVADQMVADQMVADQMVADQMVADFLRKSESVSEKLPYPVSEDNPIALRHKPANPGGEETLIHRSDAECSETRLSLFQDDDEFRESLAKIANFSDWEPLRNLGEEIPPEKHTPPRLSSEESRISSLPTDEEKSFPSAPSPSPGSLDRLSDQFDSLISSMSDHSPSPVVIPEIPLFRHSGFSSPRRHIGSVFCRTGQRYVTKKGDVRTVDANVVGTEHSLRVFDVPIPSTPPTPGEVLLVTEALTKSYYKGKLKIPVLKGVNFSVRDGEFVAIVGQSGSGKSTLLHLLGTLDNPESGTIHFDGIRIDNMPIARRDQLRNHSIGFIFQFYHLLPELTTLENVLSPLMVRESVFGYFLRRRGHIETAKRLLERVGLSHRLNHKPSELSGGEMQRAAIARALVTQPQILLADEPTGNLDARSAQEIIELLRMLNREHHLTIIMVTHDLGVAQSADRIVRMIDGRVESR